MTDDTYNPKQCAWAMSRLIERLIAEDYVRPERADELRDRAYNLEAGHGFKTTPELWSRPGFSIPATTPTPEEELLQ